MVGCAILPAMKDTTGLLISAGRIVLRDSRILVPTVLSHHLTAAVLVMSSGITANVSLRIHKAVRNGAPCGTHCADLDSILSRAVSVHPTVLLVIRTLVFLAKYNHTAEVSGHLLLHVPIQMKKKVVPSATLRAKTVSTVLDQCAGAIAGALYRTAVQQAVRRILQPAVGQYSR